MLLTFQFVPRGAQLQVLDLISTKEIEVVTTSTASTWRVKHRAVEYLQVNLRSALKPLPCLTRPRPHPRIKPLNLLEYLAIHTIMSNPYPRQV